MWMNLKNKIKEVSIENIVLLIIVPLSWLGFGEYMSALLVAGFIFSLFFKNTRELILKDRFLIILLFIYNEQCLCKHYPDFAVTKITVELQDDHNNGMIIVIT